jgi:hypothetical protein
MWGGTCVQAADVARRMLNVIRNDFRRNMGDFLSGWKK